MGADYRQQAQAMQRYYAVQSLLYDATRWAYLFGRKRVVSLIPGDPNAPLRILEVGCGTGHTAVALAERFPQATIVAYDASSHMVRRARRAVAAYGDRVQIRHAAYSGGTMHDEKYDVALFSYSLSMMHPHESDIIRDVCSDLRPGGILALADFLSTKWPIFRSVMKANHVRMDGFVLPLLENSFATMISERRIAYGGWWEYLVYIGQKKT